MTDSEKIVAPSQQQVDLPPGWGEDELSSFLWKAQQNVHGSFHRKTLWYDALRAADDCFLKIGSNLLNPKNQIAPLFLYRSHSAFRAACGTAMAGQVVETFALARLCIEYAGYALCMHSDPKLVPVWFDKSKGALKMKAFRRSFTQANIRTCIESYDRRLAEIYDELYQRAIDTGAHPNELAISGSMKIEDNPDNATVHILQIYLQNDGPSMDYALKSTVQSGLCSLHLFQWIFKERFQLLGLTDTIAALRRTRGL